MLLKQILILAFLFQFTNSSFGCCAESSYRLFPLGEMNHKVAFMELKTYRNCQHNPDYPKKGIGNEIWFSAIINLVQFNTDSIELIKNIDTIYVKECLCDYTDQYETSNFESIINSYYLQALNKVKYTAKPTTIEINDTLNTILLEGDTSYILKYKDFFTIDLYGKSNAIYELDKVIEHRQYETDNYKISIVRLSSNFKKELARSRIIDRFKTIETAFWKEQIIWHGTLMDYVFIEPK